MSPAEAWPAPEVNVNLGACDEGGTRGDTVVVLKNKESGNENSPGHVEDYVVTPNFTHTAFSPEIIPNTGSATAQSTITVPADYVGELKVEGNLVWSGSDGFDDVNGKFTEKVNVYKCDQPTTTTTTEPETTTTTEPETTTTTVPETTTTTVPETTTSTVPETTTSTVPVTTVPDTTTASVSSTTVCRGDSGFPTSCMPVAPPANSKPATPRFTG